MTTETTDPLEQAVMEAAEKLAEIWDADPMMLPEAYERLRMHVQWALAKARQHEDDIALSRTLKVCGSLAREYVEDVLQRRRHENVEEIAALEARLQDE